MVEESRETEECAYGDGPRTTTAWRRRWADGPPGACSRRPAYWAARRHGAGSGTRPVRRTFPCSTTAAPTAWAHGPRWERPAVVARASGAWNFPAPTAIPVVGEGTSEDRAPWPATAPDPAASWPAALEEAYRPGCSVGFARFDFARLGLAGFGFASLASGQDLGSSQAWARGSDARAGPDRRSAPESRAAGQAGRWGARSCPSV